MAHVAWLRAARSIFSLDGVQPHRQIYAGASATSAARTVLLTGGGRCGRRVLPRQRSPCFTTRRAARCPSTGKPVAVRRAGRFKGRVSGSAAPLRGCQEFGRREPGRDRRCPEQQGRSLGVCRTVASVCRAQSAGASAILRSLITAL
jgi:hypothetical protein